ncbi:MAG: trigger factor [Pseudomonadota bacterium]
MQVTEKLNEGLKRAYAITLPADTLTEKMNEKLDAARADFHMKGFRKGKVPPALMKKMFGKSVMGEAMQEAVQDALQSHFEETGDRPALEPKIKVDTQEWKEGEDLTLEVDYEKMPEVLQPDFSAIALERLTVEVDDEAVNEALGNLARQASIFETKEGAAEDGDQVVLDFEGRIDGTPFENGAAEDFSLVLGSGQFIPGFEDQLVGAAAGDAPQVAVTFPDSYGSEHLAGKDAVFGCTIKEVKRPVPAEINDDLAKEFQAESLADLKSQITDRLGDEYQKASRAILKRRLMDRLDEITDFELPETLVKEEAKSVAHQLWQEENPGVQAKDRPEIEPDDEHTRLAVRRVRLGLLLAEVGSSAKVAVTDTELNQALMTQAMQYRGQEKQFFDFAKKNQQIVQQVRAPLFEDKVVDYILELAQIAEKAVSKETLQDAINALDDA